MIQFEKNKGATLTFFRSWVGKLSFFNYQGVFYVKISVKKIIKIYTGIQEKHTKKVVFRHKLFRPAWLKQIKIRNNRQKGGEDFIEKQVKNTEIRTKNIEKKKKLILSINSL
jgi:hypothetical protein